MKLGVLCTHPIQYYSPLFRELSSRLQDQCIVYYCMQPTAEQQGTGFGVPFNWDVDLLSGYRSVFLENVASRPGLQRFWGCNTPGIRDAIAREGFTAFLTLGWYTWSMWQAMTAAWALGVPLLVRGDSHLHVEGSPFRRFVRKVVYPVFMRRFAACLAVGAWSEEYFVHHGARKTIRSPHFVDNSWFAGRCAEAAPEVSELKRGLGIPDHATVFLFAGKFEEKKRPLDLLDAAAGLLRSDVSPDDFHIVMVGDGVLRDACERRARSGRLPVTFVGFANQTAMPRYYALSDVVVLPSTGRETWGLVVNEGMACGLPAIVSDRVGCGPDLVMDERTGYRFPCGDVGALSESMRAMLDPGARRRMGEAARIHVASYSVGAAADGILAAMGMGIPS